MGVHVSRSSSVKVTQLVCIVSIIISILAIASVADEKGHLKLLAVAQTSKGMTGSIADLSLEIREGEGRVFLETFPPTKEDTQISMRFAKQVACAELDLDCSTKDFIYTIRAGPGIVGGPSAGAAAAMLTMSVLSGTPLRDDVAMTGTINAGGLIGPVGGLKSKLKAASKNGVKLALIPLGTRVVKQRLVVSIERVNGSLQNESNNGSDEEYDEDVDIDPGEGDGPSKPVDEQIPLIIANMTIPKNGSLNFTRNIIQDFDLVPFGKEIGIEVREVATLEDAMVAFTGKNISKKMPPFVIADEYVRIMGNISDSICGRSDVLKMEWDARNDSLLIRSTDKSVPGLNQSANGSSSNRTSSNEGVERQVIFNESMRYLELAKNASMRGDHYSAASYCFRSNIALSALIAKTKNLTQEEVDERTEDLDREIEALRTKAQSRQAATMTDLQTAMIVLERLDEAKKVLDNLIASDKDPANAGPTLAYVQERINSAKSWSLFFGAKSSPYGVDETALKNGCEDKIREAHERYEYVTYYIPNALDGVRKSVEKATALARDGGFQRCLHIASLAKAEANLIGSLIGANHGSLPMVLDQKLSVVKKSLAKTQARGNFPIIAYSYYEYANSLRQTDINSALLFADYALELSNLEMYFGPGKSSGSIGLDPVDSQGNDLTGSVVGASTGSSSSFSRGFMAGFGLAIILMVAITLLSKEPQQIEVKKKR